MRNYYKEPYIKVTNDFDISIIATSNGSGGASSSIGGNTGGNDHKQEGEITTNPEPEGPAKGFYAEYNSEW